MARRGGGRGGVIALVLGVVIAARACSGVGDSGNQGADGPGGGGGVPEGRVAVDMAVSSEKVTLLTDLARRFNDSDASQVGGGRAFVRIQKKASGEAMALLAEGWRDEATDGPRPAVWSPAASTWGAILNHRLEARGEPAMAPPSKPFMLTPLVIAMPRPMATALGYPATPIGYAEILALARDPGGWGSKGHPEWGPFKLGKTNPNFSTSALAATVAQYYAATGKTADLSLEDLARPEVDDFARGVESAVVHYGDITMTFLNNWFRNDARGTAITYISAVAVEEKSVVDYNRGNPDGILDPGEQPRVPSVPLVAVYPKEGTLFSDNPFIVLDAPWVTAKEKVAAKAFEAFVKTPANQRLVLRSGFRPGNPSVAVGAPLTAANGVNTDEPQTALEVPEPAVLADVLDRWSRTRKSARVLLVVDVSGSMGDPGGEGETKLELAKRAAVQVLDQFKPEDEVGLRIFSTEIGPGGKDWIDVVPVGPIGRQKEVLASKIRDLVPTAGTPLYTTARDAFTDARAAYDPARINAVVLLTDGRNEDPRNNDLDGLLRALRAGSEGQSTRPVRLFPVAYGADADLGVLKRMAEATNAVAYDASDPRTIERVLTAVVSNF